MEQIRLLRQDEIECRIGTINEKDVSLLLYKDARVDMKILDETYGPMNWQRSHEMIGGIYIVRSASRIARKNSGFPKWMWEQKATQKKKRDRRATALSGPVPS